MDVTQTKERPMKKIKFTALQQKVLDALDEFPVIYCDSWANGNAMINMARRLFKKTKDSGQDIHYSATGPTTIIWVDGPVYDGDVHPPYIHHEPGFKRTMLWRLDDFRNGLVDGDRVGGYHHNTPVPPTWTLTRKPIGDDEYTIQEATIEDLGTWFPEVDKKFWTNFNHKRFEFQFETSEGISVWTFERNV
jgi:hypothetical protein